MNINELVNAKNNAEVQNVNGWVSSIRDHGGLTFIDLRDFYSSIQIVYEQSKNMPSDIKNEYYISVSGVFKERDEELVNKNTQLGKYEIQASEINIINKSKTLPFQIDNNIDTDESIRLKYRYLDLRRQSMKSNIVGRSNTFKSIRKIMDKMDVLEIDTPTLIKSTPEGAKDFLVPSRKNSNTFYALPQSPQMYKQLFMMAGFPNYYQIAKCYRDEDSRKDRQPEFTQLDVEFSNANPEIVKKNIETIVKFVFKDAYDIKIDSAFKNMTFSEAISLYGTDKPDLRIKETISDCTEVFKATEINFLSDILNKEGVIRFLKTDDSITRKIIDQLDQELKELGSNGLGWFKIENKDISGPLSKLISESEKEFLISQGNGVFLFQAGQEMEIAPFLDHIRRYIFKPSTEQQFTFCWIDNFPYFEVENGNLQPSHHPFTAPTNEEDFIDNPELSTALHYDLVLNGVELGSGSQRISNPDLQRIVLEKWGLSNEEIQDRFGWFIEALSYGTPQHAGFAIGIDRLIAEVYNQNSIRDVIPFPKTQSGLDPLTDAPSYINENILEEYNLKYINKDE